MATSRAANRTSFCSSPATNPGVRFCSWRIGAPPWRRSWRLQAWNRCAVFWSPGGIWPPVTTGPCPPASGCCRGRPSRAPWRDGPEPLEYARTKRLWCTELLWWHLFQRGRRMAPRPVRASLIPLLPYGSRLPRPSPFADSSMPADSRSAASRSPDARSAGASSMPGAERDLSLIHI